MRVHSLSLHIWIHGSQLGNYLGKIHRRFWRRCVTDGGLWCFKRLVLFLSLPPVCSQFMSFQEFLVPCLCSAIIYYKPLEPKDQLSALFYKLPFSYLFTQWLILRVLVTHLYGSVPLYFLCRAYLDWASFVCILFYLIIRLLWESMLRNKQRSKEDRSSEV